MEHKPLDAIIPCLPQKVQLSLQSLSQQNQNQVQEIRLRTGRPVGVMFHGVEHFLTPQGSFTDIANLALSVSQMEVERCFQAICAYSIYRHTHEICQGFVTISGGNRVGIAGTAVYRDGELTNVRHISGLNFRVAHAVIGCAQTLYDKTCRQIPCGLLVSGPVGSGKTTMLRDLCRLIGNRYRVSLIDERSEIAAADGGIPRYDVGSHTDVLDGFPRAKGLLTALRVLTPEVLICDEIGTQADAEAILQLHGCGVPVIASAHASSWEELQQRNTLRPLFEAGVFQYMAQLSGVKLGQVVQLRSFHR